MNLFSKLFCILIISLIITTNGYAQTFDTLWTHNYWFGYFDSANCVQETSDHGFIITGTTLLEGEIDYHLNLIKTDSIGTIEWSKLIRDSGSACGFHVLETYDGGYLISANNIGLGQSGGGGIWIIKTDNDGDTLWTYPFMPEDRSGFPLYAIETIDSGFAITGRINLSGYFNDAFILRLDRDGNYVDYAHYGDDLHQDGWFITQMPDSGYIVACWDNNLYDYTDHDYWAFRTNKNLVQVWDSSYVLTDFTDEMYGACRVDDGIVMVGQARSAGHALKFDFDGNTVWSKSISQYATAERNTTACQTFDGGIIVGGWIWVTAHRRDYSIIKLNYDGDVISTFTVGGTEDDHAQFIVPTYDRNYVMVGGSSSFVNGSSVYLTKIDEMFNSTPGNDVEVILNDGVTLLYDNISVEGETTVEVNPDGPVLPGTFVTVPSDPITYYNITTTATFGGDIEVCMSYFPDHVTSDEADLTLQHFNGANWVDITTFLDTLNNIICGTTISLSPFVIAQPNPLDIGDIEDGLLPDEFDLSQNYPNPFNPTTKIEYYVPYKSLLTLTVYNLLGEKVIELVNEIKHQGNHTVIWDGKDTKGNTQATGLYFYKINADDVNLTKKMLLLK
ncbi:T9SS type A sorting domain-containing protein [Candidatus Zixiibacteriota bacterium]